jgi:galactokinase
MKERDRQGMLGRQFEQRFGRQPELWHRAPGRVDLMGSHTDYNLGYVLTMAIDRDTWLAAAPRADGQVRIHSANTDSGASFALAQIDHDRQTPWTNYVRGVADVLQKAGHRLPGLDGLVHSTVPLSGGLSSSAALEVVTAVTWRTMGRLAIPDLELALLCQRAENEFAGLDCGILDQYSSLFGRRDHVLLLDCRDLSSSTSPVAEGIRVVICDTQTKRELTGSEYSERRAQCQEGVRLLARHLPQVTSLRDVSPAALDRYAEMLPEVVGRRCRFIVQENRRVLDLAAALAEGDRPAIGALCRASYAGARDLYEIVSPEMALLMVAMLAGPGVIGARQAGAGFGGCMVAFVESDQVEAFRSHINLAYHKLSGIQPHIYPAHPAPGAGPLPAPT